MQYIYVATEDGTVPAGMLQVCQNSLRYQSLSKQMLQERKKKEF